MRISDWSSDVCSSDLLRDALVAAHGEREGLALASRYGRALSTPYLQEAGTDVAVDDVRHLAMLHGPDDLALSLHRYHAGAGGPRLKFYRRSDDIPLSDALPMLANMGRRVLPHHPYALRNDHRRDVG